MAGMSDNNQSPEQPTEPKHQPKIDPKDIQGLKYFRVLEPFLERLHHTGTTRDRAHNRRLPMDQYCTLILLWMYSPIVESLRGLQQASQLKKVQKKLKISGASLGSLSESVAVFDPEPLKQISHEVVEQRELSEADSNAGVLSDQIIRLSSDPSAVDHPLRLICISCSQHTSRGRRSGRNFSSTAPSSDGVLRIATDMLDLPAEILAELYRLRWTIELFFRMFKHLLGCRHLLSTKQNGVEIQVYAALIACMLIMLYTGRSPTKRTFEMMAFYMVGWADLDEVAGHIDKLKRGNEHKSAKNE